MNKRYYIPNEVLKNTKDFLMQKGNMNQEGYVLWKGKQLNDNEYKVTGIIIPEQIAIKSIFGYAFDISASAIEKVTTELFSTKEMGLIQVHSHPGYSTAHSDRDDKLSLLSRKGALSIVVPYFGKMPFTDFSNATVHIQTGLYKWDSLPKNKVTEILCIVGDRV